LNLERFFVRIGYQGQPACDATTLKAVHRAFAINVPYEALDIQLGKRMARDVAEAYAKIVDEGRGGWCYEANGLLAWAYESLGFKVTRLCGGVMREKLGDWSLGNHLVLLVTCEGQTWLADVGFGDGLIEPVLLREGPFETGIFTCRLEDLGQGWWRYHNDPRGASPSFDFNTNQTDKTLLDQRASWLETDPKSPFVLNAVAQIWTPSSQKTLRGRVFSVAKTDETAKELVVSQARYHQILRDHFGIRIEEGQGLWERICARHEALGLAV
jgi:N-hydroxyarylamine O-acetyltransferase